MNHDRLQELVFSLYDGELSGKPEKRQAEEHLAACPDCRKLYDDWAQSSKVFLPKPFVESSEFFVRQTMAKIEVLGRPSRRVLRAETLLRWLLPAAGFAVIWLAMVTPYSSQPTWDAWMLIGANVETDMLNGMSPTLNDTLEFVLGG